MNPVLFLMCHKCSKLFRVSCINDYIDEYEHEQMCDDTKNKDNGEKCNAENV